VIDLGSGYGGVARYLASRFACQVVALNLSEIENERNREQSRNANLDHLIEVVDGSFEDIPCEADRFSVVWSQDALLHSGNRERVLEDATRVLKPGGHLLFTDPMMADDCPPEVLDPILKRIRLQTLASPAFYRTTLARLGYRELGFTDLTDQLVNHYSRVRAELEVQAEKLNGKVSEVYIRQMKTGLGHWIEGGQNGHLVWGIFHFVSEL